jgi:hypothetical protein
MFCRQRSTLRRLYFGPKDGEHLKPPFTGRAVHCCRITTRPIIGRHALTQSLEVGAFLFVEFFEHRHTLG